jgi:signal transduction histidine kinase
MRELAQDQIPSIDIVRNIRALTSELESVVLGALVGKQLEGLRPEQVRIQERLSRSVDSYRRLRGAAISEEDTLLLDDLNIHLGALKEITTDIIGFVQRGEMPEARAVFIVWEETHHTAFEILDRLADRIAREVNETVIQSQASIESAKTAGIAVAVISIAMSLGMTLIITFSLTRPVAALLRSMERVKRGGPVSPVDGRRQEYEHPLNRRFNETLALLHSSFEDACHELRTFLTIVRGEAEVALRGATKIEQEYRETLVSIANVAEQMGRLLDDLMFLDRSQVGSIDYQMTTLDLGDLLEDVVGQSQGLATLNQVRLNVDLEDSAAVRGDALRLRQLFIILIENAINYTDDGGEVTVVLHVRSGRVKVEVSDTGIGIPKEDLPHIFQRFYRVDSGRPRREKGTGLGLAIAKSITQVHQGEITVDSAPGRGTVVAVMFHGAPAVVGRMACAS